MTSVTYLFDIYLEKFQQDYAAQIADYSDIVKTKEQFKEEYEMALLDIPPLQKLLDPYHIKGYHRLLCIM